MCPAGYNPKQQIINQRIDKIYIFLKYIIKY